MKEKILIIEDEFIEARLQTQLQHFLEEPGDREGMLLMMGRALQQYIPWDLLEAVFDGVAGTAENRLSFHRIGFDEYQSIGVAELSTMTGVTARELERLYAEERGSAVPTIYCDAAFEQLNQQRSLKRVFAHHFRLESMLSLPLLLSNGERFNLCF